MKTINSEQRDKLREMWENGCPTYDPGEYNDSGYLQCWFCNCSMLEEFNPNLKHNDGCPWLTLEELVAAKI